jgi:hypothetical protein
VPGNAVTCPQCGAELFEAPRPTRRPQLRPAADGTQLLIPTGVSGWAIASCYLGLLGFCIPFIGIAFALPAIICGIIAVSKPAKGGDYGAVTSNVRAVIGLVLGGLGLIGWTLFLLVLLTGR